MPQWKQSRETNDKWARQTALFGLVSEYNSILQTSLKASNVFLNPWLSEDQWGQGRMGSDREWERILNEIWAVRKSFSSLEKKVTKNGPWERFFFFFSSTKTVESESQVAWLDYRNFLEDWKTWLIFPHLDQSSCVFLVRKDGGRREIVSSLMSNSPFLYNNPHKANGIICVHVCPCY